MRRKDWNLLVISSAGNEGLSPVQLQKALFLLGQTVPRINQAEFYEFKAYNYGPYSKEIYLDAEILAVDGYVGLYTIQGQTWINYKSTETGIKKAKELRSELDNSIIKYIDNIVRWIQRLTFRQLLAYIYKQYPKYAKNSMFKAQQ